MSPYREGDDHIKVPFSLLQFNKLFQQAEALGVDPCDLAAKLIMEGLGHGVSKRRFVVTRGAVEVFDTIEEAERHAAGVAEGLKGRSVIVPTDDQFLGMALEAKFRGVIIQALGEDEGL